MRSRRRRRPAGSPQVPEVVSSESRSGRVFVLRLGPGRILLDLPPSCKAEVASVWLEGDPLRWFRAPWPLEPSFRLPTAPLDLLPGHVVEFCDDDGEEWSAWYACVLGVQGGALVGLGVASSEEAVAMSSRVHSIWARAQVEAALALLGVPTLAEPPPPVIDDAL